MKYQIGEYLYRDDLYLCKIVDYGYLNRHYKIDIVQCLKPELQPYLPFQSKYIEREIVEEEFTNKIPNKILAKLL